MKASISKNYIYNLLYQIFSLAIPLITAPYLARILKPDGIGAYSFANSITSYFVLLAALGTSSYAAREGARIRDDKQKLSKLFYEITILRIIMTAISYLLFFIIVKNNDYNLALYLTCGFSILTVGIDSSWFLESVENFKLLSLKDFIAKIISLVLIFTLVKTKSDLVLYIAIQTIGILIPNLLLTIFIFKKLEKVSLKDIKIIKHLKETLVYFIPSIATSIYSILDKTMIGLILKSDFESGYYDQAYKIHQIILTMITSLSTVIGARTSHLFAIGEEKEIKDIIYKAFRFLGIISIPAIVGIQLCSENFVLWYYGDDYIKVASLIRCFSPLILIIGISNILGGAYLTPVGKRKQSAIALIVGSIFNLIVNFICIPVFSTYGAILGSITAETVITILYVILSKNFVSIKKMFCSYYRYIIASLIMGVFVYFIGFVNLVGPLVSILQVTVGVITYGLVLCVMKDEDVVEIIKIIISRVGAINGK